jgi:hypothetical protein
MGSYWKMECFILQPKIWSTMGCFKVEGERSIIYLFWYFILAVICGMERSELGWVLSWFVMFFVSGHCVEIYVFFLHHCELLRVRVCVAFPVGPARCHRKACRQPSKSLDRFFSEYSSFPYQCTSVPYSSIHSFAYHWCYMIIGVDSVCVCV